MDLWWCCLRRREGLRLRFGWRQYSMVRPWLAFGFDHLTWMAFGPGVKSVQTRIYPSCNFSNTLGSPAVCSSLAPCTSSSAGLPSTCVFLCLLILHSLLIPILSILFISSVVLFSLATTHIGLSLVQLLAAFTDPAVVSMIRGTDLYFAVTSRPIAVAQYAIYLTSVRPKAQTTPLHTYANQCLLRLQISCQDLLLVSLCAFYFTLLNNSRLFSRFGGCISCGVKTGECVFCRCVLSSLIF